MMEGMTKGIKMHTPIPGVYDEVNNDEREVARDSDHDEMLSDKIYEKYEY